MSERFDGYLAQMDEQIRWARVRPALRRELMGHLEEQRDACLAEGMDETSAEVETVRQMGDPVQVGQQLDAVHRPRPQYAPLALAAVLAVCGMLIRINVNHTSSIRSLAGMGVGLVLMAALYFFDYRKLLRYAWWLYGGVVLASLALEVFCADRPKRRCRGRMAIQRVSDAALSHGRGAGSLRPAGQTVGLLAGRSCLRAPVRFRQSCALDNRSAADGDLRLRHAAVRHPAGLVAGT